MPSKFGNISNSLDNDFISHIREASFFMTCPQISQCIDGRITPNESNFGISIPGGGLGQLAIMLSVLEETIISKEKNFREKTLEILFEVVGEKENLSYHTDDNCKKGEIGYCIYKK